MPSDSLRAATVASVRSPTSALDALEGAIGALARTPRPEPRTEGHNRAVVHDKLGGLDLLCGATGGVCWGTLLHCRGRNWRLRRGARRCLGVHARYGQRQQQDGRHPNRPDTPSGPPVRRDCLHHFGDNCACAHLSLRIPIVRLDMSRWRGFYPRVALCRPSSTPGVQGYPARGAWC